MSLQISAGAKSLVALGFGISDVATLFTLGQRVGNWMTASSGDIDFLTLMEQDEMMLLTRRGMIDMAQFNKRWAKALHLLVNGRPRTLNGEKAEKAMNPFTRFTAVMVCITAALESFTTMHTSKAIVTRVLKELLRTTEYGEDVLISQISSRLNAWRSAGLVRGFSTASRTVRDELIKSKAIMDGMMPSTELFEMANFLTWLLTDNAKEYVTNSSDIGGVATCLSRMGFTVLSVRGLGTDSFETACTLVYTPVSFLHDKNYQLRDMSQRMFRPQSSIVSLKDLSESLTLFPVDVQTANQCRSAWRAGTRAAESIDLQTAIPTPFHAASGGDLQYLVMDNGQKAERVDTDLYDLLSANTFAVNRELCIASQDVLGNENGNDIRWLNEQTTEMYHQENLERRVYSPSMQNSRLIELFTRFQAFIMGYHYAIFLRLVDTTSLQMQTVDGSWGFRSTDLLTYMRDRITKLRKRHKQRKEPHPNTTPEVPVLFRQEVFEILSRLLLSHEVSVSTASRDSWCIGVATKRTLLIRSLTSVCKTPRDIGSFVLVDVDVGGIPVDTNGIVRPGEASFPDTDVVETTVGRTIRPTGPEEDLTKHVEPDWEGDPERILVCLRYKGRRLATINPSTTDNYFCMAYIEDVDAPLESQSVPNALECTVEDIVNGRLVLPAKHGLPVIVQSRGNPNLRYAAVGLYHKGNLKMAGNCVHAALRAAAEGQTKRAGMVQAGNAIVVVA